VASTELAPVQDYDGGHLDNGADGDDGGSRYSRYVVYIDSRYVYIEGGSSGRMAKAGLGMGGWAVGREPWSGGQVLCHLPRDAFLRVTLAPRPPVHRRL
jgi:hypothetical protein